MILIEDLDANMPALIERITSLYNEKKNNSRRLIISVAGIPGAGKSTVTRMLCENLNKKLNRQLAAVIPQDGFHYYREELMGMKGYLNIMKRRGAPFTFNSTRLLQLLQEVKQNVNDTIYVPEFNHELKDPTEDSIVISPQIEIIILEGNYVHLNDVGWKEIQFLTDEKWFVSADFDTIKKRLAKRHIQAGICATMNESIQRVESNDLVNATYIIDHSVEPDIIIRNQ